MFHEMHANLMRASGLEQTCDERKTARRASYRPKIGNRALGSVKTRRIFDALRRMASIGRIEMACVGEIRREGNGVILAIDAMVGKHGHERLIRLLRTRSDEQTRCIGVETMNDAGTRSIAHITNPGVVMEQGIDECMVGIAGAGMNDETGRFVDDEDIVIFVDD